MFILWLCLIIGILCILHLFVKRVKRKKYIDVDQLSMQDKIKSIEANMKKEIIEYNDLMN